MKLNCIPALQRKKKWKTDKRKEEHGGGNPDSRQRQDQLSPLVPWDRVNCLCLGSDDGMVMAKGGGGVSGPIGVCCRGRAEFQGWLKSLSGLHIHTHTYCLGVSATADWGLTIHRKVNKLLSVLCRGLHCPLASHPCILHIAHHTTHKLPDHLTSISLSHEILSKKFAD